MSNYLSETLRELLIELKHMSEEITKLIKEERERRQKADRS